jgi:outer membrane receptor protein involved in Fe transport
VKKSCYYHPSGFFANVQATFVHQEIEFENFFDNQGRFIGVRQGQDNFWVTDALVGYRLPKRHGIVSLVVKNLFDEDFSFQDSFNVRFEEQVVLAPRPPQFSEERAVLARINLWFY